MTVATMSRRFDDQLQRSQLRNFRAFAKYLDGLNAGDFSDGVQHRDEAAYERYVRTFIEGGICWRDPHARRPS